MLPTYVLARDHLERAATILNGPDTHSRQLRHIIERTISLMEDLNRREASNVLDLQKIRRERARALEN